MNEWWTWNEFGSKKWGKNWWFLLSESKIHTLNSIRNSILKTLHLQLVWQKMMSEFWSKGTFEQEVDSIHRFVGEGGRILFSSCLLSFLLPSLPLLKWKKSEWKNERDRRKEEVWIKRPEMEIGEGKIFPSSSSRDGMRWDDGKTWYKYYNRKWKCKTQPCLQSAFLYPLLSLSRFISSSFCLSLFLSLLPSLYISFFSLSLFFLFFSFSSEFYIGM